VGSEENRLAWPRHCAAEDDTGPAPPYPPFGAAGEARPVTPNAGRESGPAESDRLPRQHGQEGRHRPKVAYIMSRFPKITETFVLYEILALIDLGFDVEVYPLLREKGDAEHPDVARVMPLVHFQPFLSVSILKANWHYLRRHPLKYLGLVGRVLTATAASPGFFIGALGILPKSVRFAYDMERSGVAHVHAHFANHPALAALIVGKLSSIPFSFTAHGSDIHVDQHAFDVKIDASAFAVMISKYNKDFLVEKFGERIAPKMEIVHCGVDPDIFVSLPRSPREGFEILCVASFREVKGHTHLVEACRLLRERGVEFRCRLVGEGPLYRRIRRQVAGAGLEDRVLFCGPQARPEVVKMMQAADVVVLPSIQERQGRREGIPVTLMEAMACGLPVVSSRISGIPELVEDGATGFLTAPGDSRAIAAALEELGRSPDLRREFGERGRRKVIEEFSLGKSAARLAELFRRSARVAAVAAGCGTSARRAVNGGPGGPGSQDSTVQPEGRSQLQSGTGGDGPPAPVT
jgi:glycosyltransferase involved in cell wall biosynthesis